MLLSTGTARIAESEYLVHGDYELIVTADNLVTEMQLINTTVQIYEPIKVSSINISQPFLLHPTDPIDFEVTFEEGSRMNLTLTCTNGHRVSLA